MHKASRRPGIRLAASLIKARTGVTPRVPIIPALVIWAPTTAVSASWMFNRRVLERVVLGRRIAQVGTMCLVSLGTLQLDPKWA